MAIQRVKLTTTIDERVLEALKVRAAKEDTELNRIMEQALREYLAAVEEEDGDKTCAKAANMMGVKPSVQRAYDRVMKNGIPELVELVENEKIDIKTAGILARYPEFDQKSMLAVYGDRRDIFNKEIKTM